VDVSIPNSVTLIDNSAFNNCTSLKNLTIPASVAGMGYIAFENCSSLTNLVIGNGDGIGEQPFVGCGNLTNVVIGEGSNTIAGKAFQYNAAPVFITIPASVTSIGYAAFTSCGNLESLQVDEANSVYHSAGNCIIETNSKTLIVGCNASTIPTDGSVTIIGAFALRVAPVCPASRSQIASKLSAQALLRAVLVLAVSQFQKGILLLNKKCSGTA
jgi:hypothetical protein